VKIFSSRAIYRAHACKIAKKKLQLIISATRSYTQHNNSKEKSIGSDCRPSLLSWVLTKLCDETISGEDLAYCGAIISMELRMGRITNILAATSTSSQIDLPVHVALQINVIIAYFCSKNKWNIATRH
jgi:hypothetical protein